MSVLVSLVHLRSFLGVVEAASVTAAALALGYTQSAVSLHLKALERDLGVALFHRDRSGMPLTPAGARFVPEAREMLGLLSAVECRMRTAVATGTPPGADQLPRSRQPADRLLAPVVGATGRADGAA